MSFSKYNPKQHKTLGASGVEVIIELSWLVLNILESVDCTQVHSKSQREFLRVKRKSWFL